MGTLGTVLLAEDRQDDVLLIQKAIERAGFQNPISVVPDGRETINYLKGEDIYADRETFPFPILLILDLNPPGRRDPQGIHGAIWEEIEDDSYRAPGDKPLTLAAYSAGLVKRAYVEPVAVGDILPDMPLFLTPEACVHVPLEATYQSAWNGVPRRWQSVLEGA